MGIIAYIQFCILMLCVHSISALPESIVVHSLFHHKDPLLSAPDGMELIVFYASGGMPAIRAVNEHPVPSSAMMRRVYRIDPVCVDSGVMKRFPLISGHGYTVYAKQVGTSLELIITYNTVGLMVGLSTFNTIGNQAGFALHLCPMPTIVRSSKKINKKKMVILDAGHGGKDTGALSAFGMQEKELVLSVGLRIQKLLQERGITVVMTRTTDRDIPLDERTSLANTYGAALFVSLHANFAANKHASGIETWYIVPTIHLLASCSDAKAIPYIQGTLQQRSGGSHIPAAYTHKELIAGTRRYSMHVLDRHIKSAISQVLLGCRMPAFLIELGFLSNLAESKRLTSDVYRDIQARSICTGIVDYFTYLDKLDT
jgi:N-acetylmuramoyl-L-alanine amidase